jgi:hypothetical protein
MTPSTSPKTVAPSPKLTPCLLTLDCLYTIPFKDGPFKSVQFNFVFIGQIRQPHFDLTCP